MYTSRAILAVSVFFVVGDAFRKKSSKTDAELEGGSFVEAEANTKAGERAQTLKDMKALAHKVVAGEEKILPETLKALEKVDDVILKAESEVKPQWKEHQKELDDVRDMFLTCRNDMERQALDINATEEPKIENLKNIHQKARSIEQQALGKKARTCKKFQDYNAELSPPDCARNFPGLCEWPARISCIEDLAGWSNTHKAKYDTLKVPCEEAWQELEPARKAATASQERLEVELCKWDLKLNEVCVHGLESCWDEAIKVRQEVHPRIVIAEAALKAEFFAIQKIKCYVNVLKVSEETRVEALKGCEAEEYNNKLDKIREDTLSNTYHGIPTKPVCEPVPAPCDAEWRKTTYVEQSWFGFTAGKKFCHVFPNGPESVNLTECLQGCELDVIIPKCTASVYQHANFKGNVATFSVGEYEHDDFVSRGPLQNDKASSIKVQGPQGCKATVYEKDHFEGWHAEFPVGNFDYKEFLGKGAKNDQASSIKVTLG